VEFLSLVRHRNLVRLVGFSLEGDHRMLVYESCPRGTLPATHFLRSGLTHCTRATVTAVQAGTVTGTQGVTVTVTGGTVTVPGWHCHQHVPRGNLATHLHDVR